MRPFKPHSFPSPDPEDRSALGLVSALPHCVSAGGQEQWLAKALEAVSTLGRPVVTELFTEVTANHATAPGPQTKPPLFRFCELSPQTPWSLHVPPGRGAEGGERPQPDLLQTLQTHRTEGAQPPPAGAWRQAAGPQLCLYPLNTCKRLSAKRVLDAVSV